VGCRSACSTREQAEELAARGVVSLEADLSVGGVSSRREVHVFCNCVEEGWIRGSREQGLDGFRRPRTTRFTQTGGAPQGGTATKGLLERGLLFEALIRARSMQETRAMRRGEGVAGGRSSSTLHLGTRPGLVLRDEGTQPCQGPPGLNRRSIRPRMGARWSPYRGA
jgi:hypothetical protein